MPDTPGPDAIRAALEKVLGSPQLESAPSLCRFLRYVVEETLAGRGDLIKEYSLGAEVFGRGDFHPRIDPIVRVQARNLRARMARYYEGPGTAEAVTIDLPKRTYVPVFSIREAVPTVEEPAAEEVAEEAAVPVEAATPSFPTALPLDRPEVARHVDGDARACASGCAATRSKGGKYVMTRTQRVAFWASAVVLALSILVFTRIGLRYLVDPIGAEAAVGGTLAAPMAVTTARIGLGGFPVALALFNLTCLVSRRFSAGLKLVAIVAFTAMAVRLYSAMVDGAVPESTKLFLPESFILMASLAALFLGRNRPSTRAAE